LQLRLALVLAVLCAACEEDPPPDDAPPFKVIDVIPPGAGWDKVKLCSLDAGAPDPDQCLGAGDACCCGVECCSGICDDGQCRESCGGYGAACTLENEVEVCCSGTCGYNGCTCIREGKSCARNDDCCSHFCNPDVSLCDSLLEVAPPRPPPASCTSN